MRRNNHPEYGVPRNTLPPILYGIPRDWIPPPPAKLITLSWHNVTYSIPTGKPPRAKKPRVILNNHSGIAEPGSIVAIMGASGAGKSTLLNVLAGRIGKGDLTGQILVNGSPRSPATWQSTIAYVEQQDLMLENFSVRETLTYAARLRLPRTMSEEDKTKRVDKMITLLGLSKVRDSRIGGEAKRGISGGEKKRVSIGVELITEKKLVFLDEPTSGLDAFTALTVIDSVRKLADEEGCTIVMTIHQPREAILKMIDTLILLSETREVFYGSVSGAIMFFSYCGFVKPPDTNPSDFFLDIMTLDTRTEILEGQSRQRIQFLQEHAAEPTIRVRQVQQPPEKLAKRHRTANSFLVETWILFSRDLKDSFRDPGSLLAQLIQAVAFALIIGFVFFQMSTDFAGIQNRLGSLFFITIQITFANVNTTLATFPLRILVIKRERAAETYRSGSAYVAAALALLPAIMLSTLVLGLIVYWLLGLQRELIRYINFVATLVILGISANGLGLLISSLVKNIRIGQVIAPLAIIIFVLFAGQLVNLKTTPGVLRWLRYISFVQYSFAALNINEFTGLKFECNPNIPQVPGCVLTGEEVLKQYNLLTFSSVWINNLFVIVIGLVFYVLGYFVFHFRSRPMIRLE